MAPSCTRSKEGKDAAPRPRAAKAEKEKNEGRKSEAGSAEADASMKGLLKEANEMLKSMQSSPTSSQTTSPTSSSSQEEERKEVMERLQQQLNMLKQKTFRLRRLQKGEKEGLLDSGAAHPLRPLHQGEKVETYKKVQVALADGQSTTLAISRR